MRAAVVASSRGHQRTPAQIQSPKLKEAAMPLVSEEIGEPSLLLFPPACPPDGARSWGCCDGPTMNAKITDCYNKVIYWRRIVFRVPSGRAGKALVCELARLFQGFAEETRIESYALTAAAILPHLLLQKPHVESKAKDHAQCLDRRLELWFKGEVEVRYNPTASQGTQAGRQGHSVTRLFCNLMKMGKVREAMHILSEDSKGETLPLDLASNADEGTEMV